ncbi:MAG: hypothetical protein Q9O74_10750 [Planctomycetota bacterium]|nr:hypothetical protein [Planctomycetota bacterium]
MQTRTHHIRTNHTRHKGVTPALLMALACALPGCGGSGGGGAQTRAEKPGVNVGLEAMVGDNPSGVPLTEAETELEALIAEQTAQLAEAYGTPIEDVAEPDPITDSSLSNLLGADGDAAETEAETTAADTTPDSPEDVVTPPTPVEETADAVAGETEPTTEAAAPEPTGVELLYAQLDEALGQELDTTSEPFRTAVAMIAMAAAQGKDPLEAIGPNTKAGAALSPAERDSAAAVAEMLSSVLSPGEISEEDRATALRTLSDRLNRSMGLNIPRALLCTEVRGFGRYTPFPKTDFLAGRRIRALLYVEVDSFEHREVDTSNLGGLPVEERWAIDLTQTLELYHDGEGEILAWKRPEEIVVETSRNKQRDFYLLTEISLPETLTVGSFQLKVIIRDRVAGARTEMLIPIGIVADPALAWTPR